METGNQTQNQENNTQQEANQEMKTYTQNEVNSIVQERLARERAKYEGFEDLKAKAEKFDAQEEANKSELQKAQEKATELEEKLKSMEREDAIRKTRIKVAEEKGIPENWRSLLTGETEEACTRQAEIILENLKGTGYPELKDGGEVTTNQKLSTREQFKQWTKNNNI